MDDVIVHGIEIPYSCLPCALQKWDMCAATGYNVTTYIAFQERPDWCPMKPVKRGRWMPVDSYSAYGGDEATWCAHGNPVAFYYCSECKEQNYLDESGEPLLTDYCPSCGAKMEGDYND